jgi:hypothetical protein
MGEESVKEEEKKNTRQPGERVLFLLAKPDSTRIW